MLLNTLPLLAVQLEGFDEAEMFVNIPPTGFLAVGISTIRESSARYLRNNFQMLSGGLLLGLFFACLFG